MPARRCAIRARSRRLVRFLTTAAPTDLDTTKPTRGGHPTRASVWLAWTTMSLEPDRAPPAAFTAPAKSAPRRSRCRAGSTAEPQAESSERPLRRRAARIARPARVRMRRRNPWVLARRRLFGWKVRLLTIGLRNCRAQDPGCRRGGRCRPPSEARVFPWFPRACENGRQAGHHGTRAAATGSNQRRCWTTPPLAPSAAARATTRRCGMLRRASQAANFADKVAATAAVLLASRLAPPSRPSPTGCG
jgi:hypothetical protein